MIGNKLHENENIKPNSLEMRKLKETFPQYFNNKGEFEIDKFKDFLKQEEVEITKEGYELKFLGKSYAKYVSSLETETYISPDVEHNSREENINSKNLYIVGDNMDALKHLLSSYAGKIKCIYIDPPYNTGSDGFVYPDNFQFKSEELSQRIGITEEEAQRILDLEGKSTHSAWLTFIYPRLVLARDLLSDEGVIFISIDDNEQANLKLVCDEIFGEENFVGCFSRATGTTTGQDAHKVGSSLDYCIAYSKTNTFDLGGIPLSENDAKRFNREDKRGKFSILQLRKTGNEDRKEDRETMFFPIKAPDGAEVYPFGPEEYLSRWRMSRDSYEELLKNDMIYWEYDEKPDLVIDGYKRSNWTPYVKYYLEGRTKQISNLLTDIEGNKKASIHLKKLFGVKDVFTNPKPVEFLKILIQISQSENSIVLDFFSGSSTTAEAVIELNAKQQRNTKYIMVQIPEIIDKSKPAYKLGFRTIDQVGRARIEKASQKIKEETNADIDYGYKLYYLETPEEKTLLDLENFEPEVKFITDDMVSVFDNEHSSGKESILATWLNEDGYGLTRTSIPFRLESYEANLMDKSLYLIDEGLEDEDIMTLIKGIENETLDITRVVVYVHSVRFSVLQELRKNLKVLRNNKNVTLIERF